MNEEISSTGVGGVAIYDLEDGSSAIDVRVQAETVWVNRQQLAALYGRDAKTIGKHVANALREELAGIPVVAKYATTAADGKTYQVEHYNLDMVVSVGYRVKSPEGVRFRRWATTVLRNHLVKGYTVNQRRLEQLQQALQIVARSEDPEIAGVAGVLQIYADGLTLLDDYDHQRIAKPDGRGSDWVLDYDEARAFVDSMRLSEDSKLFGVERDGSFSSSVATIYQGFSGQDFYPSVEEKAANLLYLVVKNHSFVDGNKRIAAALFVYFLDRNGILRQPDGTLVIDNAALAGLTLMVALSKPREKDVMCNLVMNCLAPGPDETAGGNAVRGDR
ncbi:MAG: virulence RhuM family protein [Bifidobacteriaceae bacterium]|jgi:prophage maintenance system killer protein|nr:virulence RhuM family protein [Bifidobacteriaceae bacterium]